MILLSVMSKEIIERATEAAGRGDFKEAASLLTPLAKGGSAEAQFLLGSLYREDHEMPEMEAYRWIKLAADQNHPEACFQWACISVTEGGLRSKTEAEQAQLLHKAADLGSMGAWAMLGLCYAAGELGVTTNPTESFKWYSKAAEAGDSKSQYEIGFMYLLGEGTKKDTTQAVKWLKNAAETGHVSAYDLLIQIYEEGTPEIAKDSASAAEWRKRKGVGFAE